MGGEHVRRSAAILVPSPAQGPGGTIGKPGRKSAAPGKTGGLKKQSQNQKGQGHHENGDLRIGLAGNIGGPSGRDTGKKRHAGSGQNQYSEKDNQSDFLSSGRRRYVHGIDVAILASTLTLKQANAVRV